MPQIPVLEVNKAWIYILAIALIPIATRAQQTTQISRVDTAALRSLNIKDKKLFAPNPKKAGMYSSILPGWGQAYNHQYWKVPVIYVGVAAAGYFLQFNFKQYRTFRKAYIYRIDTDQNTVDDYVGIYTADDLKTLQETYRDYIDMTVLLTALGYGIQILDAVASAHLRNFDISPDISMRFQPILQPQHVGVGLVVNFK